MKADIWMPLYVADLLADTLHLSRCEFGSYVLLICAYWRKRGPLPDNDEELAAIARASQTDWFGMRLRMANFFQVDGGGWRHKRIDAELVKANAITEARSKAGRRGSRVRWGDKSQMSLFCDSNRITNAIQNDAPSQSQSPIDLNANDRFVGEVYEAYPRKGARKEAVRAITRQIAKHGAEKLLTQTRLYSQTMIGADPQFIPHAATWFNQERFLETPEQWRPLPNANRNQNNRPGSDRNAGTYNNPNDYANVV